MTARDVRRVSLSQLEALVLPAALSRLLKKPTAGGTYTSNPFVLIEEVDGTRFVQFGGTMTEPLFIDCHAHRQWLNPVGLDSIGAALGSGLIEWALGDINA